MTTSIKFNKKSGFTLIEILIAMFILSVGIMGVTGMFTTSMKAGVLGRNATVGNRLAQNLMEQVKTQTFSSALADMCTSTGILNCITTPDTTTYVAGDTDTGAGTFTEASGGINVASYSVTLQQVENTPITGLNTVTVTVAWSDAFGAHTTRLITYIEKP